MKILHILYSGLGGHGNVFFSLVQADAKKSYQYEALFTGIEPLREEYRERCEANGIPYHFIKKDAGKHFVYFFQIMKRIQKSDANIIFLHGSTLISAVWLSNFGGLGRKKIIIRETQAIHLKSDNEVLGLKLAMKLATRIIFLSDAYALQTRKDLGRNYNDKKVSVIPNGINLQQFFPKPKSVSDTITIGMQSRIVPIKDHTTLLKAFAKIKEIFPSKKFKLVIAGDGESLPKVKELAKNLEILGETEFTGMLTEKQLPAYLNNLDIYVHASFGETMSTAIMQAMACGKCIIASDVDGINNMIEDRITGLLVPVENTDSLTDAIKKIIENSELRSKLEEAAFQNSRTKFSNDMMFQRYSKIFNEY